MPGAITTDKYGHENLDTNPPTQLTAGAVGVTTAGTISGTTNAGAAPTVTITDCTDRAGSFLLNPVTGGGAQAAGSVATVRFVQPYGRPPKVLVNMVNETDGNVVVATSAASVNGDGFSVTVGAVLITAKAYRCYYLVVA